VALSPDDRLLLTIDVEDHALLINYQRSVILHRFYFKRPVRVCVFSPCGLYFAVSYGNHVQIWRSPGLKREFNPFVLLRTYTGLGDGVVSVEWSSDSTVIMASCKNGTVRIWTVEPLDGYVPVTLSGHKSCVVGAYFDEIPNGSSGHEILRRIYSVSSDGAVVTWRCSYKGEEQEDNDTNQEESSDFVDTSAIAFFSNSNRTKHAMALSSSSSSAKTQAEHLADNATWSTSARHYLHQNTLVSCTTHSAANNLLVIGFASGIFGLYELPSMSNIHNLSLSNQSINTVAVNKTGEWLAFGCASTQQLLVWEWRSESYVVKQSGHWAGMRCMSYSGDGVVIATGGEDGSLKLWNTSSGYCYCTMKSHTAPVTACVFANSSVVMTASLDGTVRAHDLNRYRNFKTYTTSKPCQFTSIAVDPAGEVLVAGSTDPFHLYAWSVQTGRILDVLTGHVGPISNLTFQSRGVLASSSWDGTVKLWDLYKAGNENNQQPESLRHSQDVVCCAFRLDGMQLCTGTIGGLLSFWKVEDCSLIGEIDGRRDIAGGRKVNDRMTSYNNSASRYFNSVCYSADGACVLAGGNSKYICVYEISQRILVKKFQVSFNRSLDGVLDELNSKMLGDGGPINSQNKNYEEDEQDSSIHLPGAKRGDDGSRKTRIEVMTKQVSFSPTGREWAAVSNEGLHIYSLDDDMIFDPISLTEEITPGSVLSNLYSGKHGVALVISLHLNEYTLVKQVIENTPYASITHVVKFVGQDHLEKLIKYITECMKDSPHVEFYITWCLEILNTHSRWLEKRRSTYMQAFRLMRKAVLTQSNGLERICNENRYMLDFLTDQSQLVLEQQKD